VVSKRYRDRALKSRSPKGQQPWTDCMPTADVCKTACADGRFRSMCRDLSLQRRELKGEVQSLLTFIVAAFPTNHRPRSNPGHFSSTSQQRHMGACSSQHRNCLQHRHYCRIILDISSMGLSVLLTDKSVGKVCVDTLPALI
jgi:hypothetical protein